MAISISTITAEDRIENIECHFKVSAGPGAGKTRWLINHIQHVVKKSERLGNSRKIACITYTNVAAETILDRLGTRVDRVEVSTFHSFLYKHLIRPFSFLIPMEYELNIEKMDGHSDIPVYKGMLFEWKQQTKQIYIKDDNKIIKALNDLIWKLGKEGEINLALANPYKGRVSKTVSIKNDSYLEYKKMCWRKGLLDHEDVLFFSYIMITKFPRIVDVLRAKFPYVFIDEFQDTNPIQTYILKKISESETIVGIIGDVAQSIYGFQGAKPDHFTTFSLPGLNEYSILDNHRCTNKIISILNNVRTDISQIGKRNIEGVPPRILIGDKIWALDKAGELIKGVVCSLSRDNITSNIMRDKVDYAVAKTNLIDDLRENDSNASRMNIISACIKATEFARQLKYKDALKELTKELSREVKKSELKIDVHKFSLRILKALLFQHGEFQAKNLLAFYTIVSDIISPMKIAGFKAGAAKVFYENNIFHNVALSVNIQENTSFHRTIHKAKGAEFCNVILVLDKRDKNDVFLESEELGFICSPNLMGDEEHRVRYVAISRAKDSLFINIPSISNVNENVLIDKGFEIIKQ